ncbi:MAG: InlB B-repeat-containing protein [Bifidobacterium sp.]|uniref:InlB B-repeat-containing protein n=1 Tax=Bifidobacterium sp. TaxID=41200 RepID=UPI0039E7F742
MAAFLFASHRGRHAARTRHISILASLFLAVLALVTSITMANLQESKAVETENPYGPDGYFSSLAAGERPVYDNGWENTPTILFGTQETDKTGQTAENDETDQTDESKTPGRYRTLAKGQLFGKLDSSVLEASPNASSFTSVGQNEALLFSEDTVTEPFGFDTSETASNTFDNAEDSYKSNLAKVSEKTTSTDFSEFEQKQLVASPLEGTCTESHDSSCSQPSTEPEGGSSSVNAYAAFPLAYGDITQYFPKQSNLLTGNGSTSSGGIAGLACPNAACSKQSAGYWLRSPLWGSADLVYSVDRNGLVETTAANGKRALRPAVRLDLSKLLLTSSAKDQSQDPEADQQLTFVDETKSFTLTKLEVKDGKLVIDGTTDMEDATGFGWKLVDPKNPDKVVSSGNTNGNMSHSLKEDDSNTYHLYIWAQRNEASEVGISGSASKFQNVNFSVNGLTTGIHTSSTTTLRNTVSSTPLAGAQPRALLNCSIGFGGNHTTSPSETHNNIRCSEGIVAPTRVAAHPAPSDAKHIGWSSDDGTYWYAPGEVIHESTGWLYAQFTYEVTYDCLGSGTNIVLTVPYPGSYTSPPSTACNRGGAGVAKWGSRQGNVTGYQTFLFDPGKTVASNGELRYYAFFEGVAEQTTLRILLDRGVHSRFTDSGITLVDTSGKSYSGTLSGGTFTYMWLPFGQYTVMSSTYGALTTITVSEAYQNHIVNYWTVRYNLGGADEPVPPDKYDSVEVLSGTVVNRLDGDPKRLGYIFDGWYTSRAGTTVYAFGPITDTTTIYAHWIKSTETVNVTVTIHKDNSSWADHGKSGFELRSSDGAVIGGAVNGDVVTFNDVTAGNYDIYNASEGRLKQLTVTDADTEFSLDYYTTSFDTHGADTPTPDDVITFSGRFISAYPPVPEKAGHTFNGWMTAEDSSTYFFFFSITTSGTAHARWIADSPSLSTVTVTLQKDGSAWIGHAKTDFALTPDDGLPIFGTVSGASVTFADVPDGSYTLSNTPDGMLKNITVSSTATTFTVDYYTISFDTHGADTPPPEGQIVLSGSDVSPPAAPTKSGFTFQGWKTADGGLTAFTFTNITATATAHAAWSTGGSGSEDQDFVTVTVRKDGSPWTDHNKTSFVLTSSEGTAIDGSVSGATVSFTDVPDDTYDLSNTPDGILKSITVSSTATSFTVDYYTVSFDTHGADTATPANQIILSGKNASQPSDPTRSGYTFEGWMTTHGGSSGFNFSNITGSGTAHARWNGDLSPPPPGPDTGYDCDPPEAIYDEEGIQIGWEEPVCTPQTFTIYLNNDGGSTSPPSFIATYDAAAPSIPLATFAGYTFQGYYTACGGGGQQVLTSSRSYVSSSAYTSGGKWTSTSSSLTFCAKWTRVVNLDYDDGGSAPDSSFTATYHSSAISGMPGAPSLTYYIFAGFRSAKNGGGTQVLTTGMGYISSASGFTSGGQWVYTGASQLTLYAHWTFTVTYNGNGQSSGTVPGNATVTRYDSYDLKASSPKLTKNGFTYRGWNLAADGNRKSYFETENDVYFSPPDMSTSGVVTLYARWTRSVVTQTGGLFEYKVTLSSSMDVIVPTNGWGTTAAPGVGYSWRVSISTDNRSTWTVLDCEMQDRDTKGSRCDAGVDSDAYKGTSANSNSSGPRLGSRSGTFWVRLTPALNTASVGWLRAFATSQGSDASFHSQASTIVQVADIPFRGLDGDASDASAGNNVGANFLNGTINLTEIGRVFDSTDTTYWTKATSAGNNFAYRMFSGDAKLTTLAAGSFSTGKLTSAGDGFFERSFAGTTALATLPAGSFDTNGLTTVGGSFFAFAFLGDTGLPLLPDGSFKLSNIEMGGNLFFDSAFKGANKLETLPTGSFNLSKLAIVGNRFFAEAFSGATKLGATSIPLPSDAFRLISTSLAIGDEFFASAFQGATSLAALPSGSFNLGAITNAKNAFFQDAFSGDNKLTTLATDSFNLSNITTSGNSFFARAFRNAAVLNDLPADSFKLSNEELSVGNDYFAEAFYNNESLTDVPADSFEVGQATTAGTGFMKLMFAGEDISHAPKFKRNTVARMVVTWSLNASNVNKEGTFEDTFRNVFTAIGHLLIDPHTELTLDPTISAAQPSKNTFTDTRLCTDSKYFVEWGLKQCEFFEYTIQDSDLSVPLVVPANGRFNAEDAYGAQYDWEVEWKWKSEDSVEYRTLDCDPLILNAVAAVQTCEPNTDTVYSGKSRAGTDVGPQLGAPIDWPGFVEAATEGEIDIRLRYAAKTHDPTEATGWLRAFATYGDDAPHQSAAMITAIKDVPFFGITSVISDTFSGDFVGQFMFKECVNLARTGRILYLDVPIEGWPIPDKDWRGITTIGKNFLLKMFEGDFNLTTIPDGSFNLRQITTVDDRFLDSLFKGAAALPSLPVGGFNISALTSVGSSFLAESLSDTAIVGSPVGSLNMANIVSASDKFLYQTFLGATKLRGLAQKSFHFNDALVSLGEDCFYQTFYGAESMIAIPKWSFNTANITTVGVNYFYQTFASNRENDPEASGSPQLDLHAIKQVMSAWNLVDPYLNLDGVFFETFVLNTVAHGDINIEAARQLELDPGEFTDTLRTVRVCSNSPYREHWGIKECPPLYSLPFTGSLPIIMIAIAAGGLLMMLAFEMHRRQTQLARSSGGGGGGGLGGGLRPIRHLRPEEASRWWNRGLGGRGGLGRQGSLDRHGNAGSAGHIGSPGSLGGAGSAGRPDSAGRPKRWE